MNINSLKDLLQSVADGKTHVKNAVDEIRKLPFEDIDYAHIDHHRSLRKGFPEVIFGQGKTAEQICGILDHMAAQETIILVTRVEPVKAEKVLHQFSDAAYHADARMIVLQKAPPNITGRGTILGTRSGHLRRHI